MDITEKRVVIMDHAAWNALSDDERSKPRMPTVVISQEIRPKLGQAWRARSEVEAQTIASEICAHK